MASATTQSVGELTIRLKEWASPAQLTQDMNAQLAKIASESVIVIIDLSLARSLGQPVKAALYRLLEQKRVYKIGFCGASSEAMAEFSDLLPLLARVRPVHVAGTEAELRMKLGLSQPVTEPKLGGMLSYLKPKNVTRRFDQP
jgi:hypothetical protein